MKKIFTCIALLFLVFELSGQELIPRATFYSPKDKLAVKIDQSGNYIGYIDRKESGVHLHIEAIDKSSRKVTFKHKLSRQPGFWKFMDNEQILFGFPTREGYKLHIGNYVKGTSREIKLPVNGRLRLIEHTRHLIFSIYTLAEETSGFYAYDSKKNRWSKILDHGRFYDVRFNTKLEPIFGIEYRSGDVTFLRKPKNDSWKKVGFYKWPASFPVDIVSVDQNDHDVYLLENSSTDKTALVKLNIETGKRVLIAQHKQADINSDFNLIDPLTGKPEILTAVYGERLSLPIKKEYKKDISFLKKQGLGDIEYRGRNVDGKKWLLSYFKGGLQSYYIYDRAKRMQRFLFIDHEGLQRLQPAIRVKHIIKASDGVKLPCMLFLPPGSDKNKDGIPDQPLPTIQIIHGGPWVGYYQFGWQMHRNIQLYVNRGYAVIYSEFRGATGYGKKFTDLGNLQWGAKMHQDVIDVGNWLIDHKVTPKNKLAISGVSYGAYASYMALAKQPDMYQCAVTKYGPTDLEVFLKTPVASNEIWRTRVGNDLTVSGRELLRAHSPVHLVKAIKKPILMSHGSRDRMAPQSQSDVFAKALKKHSKEFIYTVYPNEGHDYRNPNNNISYMAMAEFLLHKCLGGRYEAVEKDVKRGRYKVENMNSDSGFWNEISN